MSKRRKKVESPGFWKTIPGFLTAIAAVITAVAGFITVLYATGLLGTPSQSNEEPHDANLSAASPQEVQESDVRIGSAQEAAEKVDTPPASELARPAVSSSRDRTDADQLEETRDSSPADVSESITSQSVGEHLIPVLAFPRPNSTIGQPFFHRWYFEWDEPPNSADVERYHLRVFAENAAYPVINIKTKSAWYAEPANCTYVHRLKGWTWQVRAQFRSGEWGPWTQPWLFNVMVSEKKVFCQVCPEGALCEQ